MAKSIAVTQAAARAALQELSRRNAEMAEVTISPPSAEQIAQLAARTLAGEE